jgi:isoleucyl-tRNA synthetase
MPETTGKKHDYSGSVQLPQTGFPMRAGLAENEPKQVALWEKAGAYARLRALKKGRPQWVLHDGPPFANGNIHMGHALNKVLKDFIVRYKTMRGFDSPYVPGYDTHGMPIEYKVVKDLRAAKQEVTPSSIREKSAQTADFFIQKQTSQFKRLGVWGDWEHPYVTKDPAFEAGQLDAYWSLLNKGQIYRGKKPVHWCVYDQTALAEAELEYQDHKSPSIYVKFRLNAASAAKLGDFKKPVYAVIWTTTPWTLPANVAIALNEKFNYGAYDTGQEVWILGQELADGLFEKAGIKPPLVKEFKGKEFDRLEAGHPFIEERSVLLCLAPYVTAESGTGLVHTAPGHGADDYVTGVRYGLPILCPVDAEGKYTELFEPMRGQRVTDPQVNARVIELLKEKNALIFTQDIAHSYPHCWRCKNPIIFRATEQWFMSLEKNGLREQVMEQTAGVTWHNKWGSERFANMMKDRADWCISRQRYWGVPIYMFYDEEGKPFFDHQCYEKLRPIVEKEGGDAWFKAEGDPGRFLPEHVPGDRSKYTMERDILDVWFDSGSSHMAVLKGREGLPFPADMYMEGSDQYRGWFQSSMLVSVGVNGSAPYKEILSTGWVLDSKGKAMHKSAGNVVDPLKIMDKYGADILRLWVSSEDATTDLGIGDEILTRVSDSYRRLRNSYRWLLGNLNGFDPAQALPLEQMQPLDRWLLHQLSGLIQRCGAAMDKFEFQRFYQEYVQFFAVTLSSLIFDVHKDTLYTLAPADPRRRSAQTALYHTLSAVVRLGAPVLAFTSEEVWGHMDPKWKDGLESVHYADWPAAPAAWTDEALAAEFDLLLRAVRPVVTKRLEEAREAGIIKHPYDAEVRLAVNSKTLKKVLDKYAGLLPALFVVSTVVMDPAPPQDGAELRPDQVAVSASGHEKCARCWRRPGDVNEQALCTRCEEALHS